MNLRESTQPQIPSRLSQFSAPNLRVPTMNHIVGNLGEDLDHGPRTDPDEEVEEVQQLDHTRAEEEAPDVHSGSLQDDVIQVCDCV